MLLNNRVPLGWAFPIDSRTFQGVVKQVPYTFPKNGKKRERERPAQFTWIWINFHSEDILFLFPGEYLGDCQCPFSSPPTLVVTGRQRKTIGANTTRRRGVFMLFTELTLMGIKTWSRLPDRGVTSFRLDFLLLVLLKIEFFLSQRNIFRAEQRIEICFFARQWNHNHFQVTWIIFTITRMGMREAPRAVDAFYAKLYFSRQSHIISAET